MTRFYLTKNITPDGVFYYFNLSRGSLPSKKIWVSSHLVQKELEEGKEVEFIEFPLKNASIKQTEKGTLVIKKGANNVFYYTVKCGYRGSAEAEIKGDVVNQVYIPHYRSPRGNLGISAQYFIETPEDKIRVDWHKTGRLYGQPNHGSCYLTLDGGEICVDGDVDEIKELLE